MKRKAQDQLEGGKKGPKRAKDAIKSDPKQGFRKGLFDPAVLSKYTSEYAASTPYLHGVIQDLVDDSLLRNVRKEIRENVHFTTKETDIYKIHQSGDLANLDGLDDEALAKLPSLMAVRDAMYSAEFRKYVADITGCGPLSGTKTDMAVNIYTPGCYLLCHDDVIGSRRVSYILYLTDPEIPWQAEWGGALRLYPVVEQKGTGEDGKAAKTPLPDPVKIIPPAWNQLSFFAVQPGESFHDVEEVYHAATDSDLEQQGGRVRMAISGWFHIPQEGEAGFVEGAEAAQAHKSGLAQLQGNPDQYDQPQAHPKLIENLEESKEGTFDEADLEFLLKYLAPTYLTPDTLQAVAEQFEDESSVSIPTILNAKFAEKLRKFIEDQEAQDSKISKQDSKNKSSWKVAKPPHKHRFMYLEQSRDRKTTTPIQELLDGLLPSRQFRTWLQMATGCTITSYDSLARRFRHGYDYTLATGHEGEACLEINLGFTPTSGWGGEDDEEADRPDSEDDVKPSRANGDGKPGKKAKKSSKTEIPKPGPKEDEDVGGQEVYMAGGDDDEEDAAIYKSSNADEDDGILFSQPAAWNTMTIVLRDSGTLRFTKYVSRKAKGDRWDISGTFGIEDTGDDDAEQDEEEEETEIEDNVKGVANGKGSTQNSGSILDDDTEEEFQGFSDSAESSD